METITDFYLFMLSVAVISLSGVMSPGPLFAVTIAKSARDKKAGLLISFGHGLVEFPLMFLIYFGFAWLFTLTPIQKTISLVGGMIMIYMGIQVYKTRHQTAEENPLGKHGSLVSAVLATAGNPYFLLWWATIGAALVTNATYFGFLGFTIFSIIHWSCDLIWNIIVSYTVFKTKHFWTQKIHKTIVIFCFTTLTGFGIWFIVSTIL